MFFHRKPAAMPTAAEALPGRGSPTFEIAPTHVVTGAPMTPPFGAGLELAMFGMGCFWGAERRLWQTEGVVSTQAGYAAGHTPHPTYDEVCSGRTGHNEVVRVVFDPNRLDYRTLLRRFWEGHDPTQGMRQGNDLGTQYRSGVYVYTPVQRQAAEAFAEEYSAALAAAGLGPITTEIVDAPTFYYAEDHHQQYLAKNPNGYCGLGGTGVSCPIGVDPG